MGLLASLNISASGMTAQRLRMDLIAANLANVNTTRTASGGPYRRQTAVFEAVERAGGPGAASGVQGAGLARGGPLAPGGVRVRAVIEDPAPPRLVFDPSHPDADEQGYVAYPNVDVVTEMVDLVTASRAYEANVTAFGSAKEMASRAIDLLRA